MGTRTQRQNRFRTLLLFLPPALGLVAWGTSMGQSSRKSSVVGNSPRQFQTDSPFFSTGGYLLPGGSQVSISGRRRERRRETRPDRPQLRQLFIVNRI